MIWVVLAASVMVLLAVRSALPRLRWWRTRRPAARILAGCDLDLALEQLFWDEGCYYGGQADPPEEPWDSSHCLDDVREDGAR